MRRVQGSWIARAAPVVGKRHAYFRELTLPRFPTLGDETWSKFFQLAVSAIPTRRFL